MHPSLIAGRSPLVMGSCRGLEQTKQGLSMRSGRGTQYVGYGMELEIKMKKNTLITRNVTF